MTGQLSRRDVARFLLAGSTALAMAEAGWSRPARAEDVFTIASTGGTYGDALMKAYVKNPGFAEKEKLEVVQSTQLESIAASKMQASCGHPPYTVGNFAQGEAALLSQSSCLQAYDTSKLTHYGDIYDAAKLGDYYASMNLLMFGLSWNTKLAKKPASYKDLWLAENNGKVGVPAYGWYGIYWLHAVNKVFGGDEDNITPGMTAIAQLVKKGGAVIADNADHANKLFEREEIALMPYFNGRTTRMQDAGLPTDFVYVDGTIVFGSGFTISKGTKYLDAAHRFVDLTLAPENQIEFSRFSKYPPTNKTAKLPPELEKIKVPAEAFERVAKLDYVKINKYRDPYLERWNKEVLG